MDTSVSRKKHSTLKRSDRCKNKYEDGNVGYELCYKTVLGTAVSAEINGARRYTYNKSIQNTTVQLSSASNIATFKY